MKNNEAFYAKLMNITPIEGADKIIKADVVVNGIAITQVVSGVDTVEGQEIVYFDSNMCLSPAVLKQYPDLGNYLSKNGRVKVVKLRKTISNGLAVSFQEFRVFDSGLRFIEGESFLSIGDVEICHKYQPSIQVQKQGTPGKKGKPQLSRMISGQFNFHIDTPQFFRNVHAVKPDDVISISRKTHGTSFIMSNCLVKKKLTFKELFAKFFGVDVVATEYDLIASSRKVVKNGLLNQPSFYKEDIWTAIKNDHFQNKLHPGETVYGECLGYLKSGGFIQKGYSYGCKPFEHKLQIYRITTTDTDGNVTELGWQAMKDRAAEMGIPTVEEYYFGRASDLIGHSMDAEEWNVSFAKHIRSEYLEKMATDCGKKIPDEGVVIRVEGLKINPYKAKSDAFFLYESKANETEDNIEESES